QRLRNIRQRPTNTRKRTNLNSHLINTPTRTSSAPPRNVKNIYVTGRHRLRHTTHTGKEKGQDRVGRQPGVKRSQEPSGEVLEGLRSRPCGP
ncbi:MAG: hypothetical protein M3441_27450, partial [Chloroflexota bacterium]|nr:hypothetical protein [Chloroflexota bacterium]